MGQWHPASLLEIVLYFSPAEAINRLFGGGWCSYVPSLTTRGPGGRRVRALPTPTGRRGFLREGLKLSLGRGILVDKL